MKTSKMVTALKEEADYLVGAGVSAPADLVEEIGRLERESGGMDEEEVSQLVADLESALLSYITEEQNQRLPQERGKLKERISPLCPRSAVHVRDMEHLREIMAETKGRNE